MATNRNRRTRGRAVGAGGITEADYVFFSFGDFFEGEDWAKGKSEKEIEEFWKAHRGAIMDRYFSENRARGPGSRPWPFWKWEMTEPRRGTEPKEFKSQKVWDHHLREFAWVETDLEYLKRLGLLEPWEQ